MHKYNIIGTDQSGDWLMDWADSKEEADRLINRYKNDHKLTHLRRIYAVKCAA